VWGGNIRRWRKAKGIARSQMAEDLDVTLATISRWEAGIVMPRDEQKLRIAKYLEMPAVAIFPLTEVPS
jgi:transcriptional regulator with XRE-family HTH domain